MLSRNNNHNNVLVIIVCIALEIEKVGQYPCPSLLSLATDDRKQFQSLNIVLNDKTEFNRCEDRF